MDSPRAQHSFVSHVSEHGVHVEEIAQLVGHAGGSQVTERVYRTQLRPLIQTGGTAMDGLLRLDEFDNVDDA